MHRDLLERHAVLRLLVYLVTIVGVLYTGGLIWSAITHFSAIILLFFLAWIVAFILQPVTLFLERRGLPRLVAVALTYLSVVALAVGVIILAIPLIQAQVEHFAGDLTATFTPTNLAHISDLAVAWLQRFGLRKADATQLVSQFSNQLPGFATKFGNQAVGTATQLFSLIATLLFDTILVAILSFYMMLDGDQLVEGWIQRLPPSWLPDVRLFQRQVEIIFGGFLRAQLIIGAAYGLLTGIVLAALGLGADAFIFAVLSALIMLIPFIGPFLALVPPLILVLLQSPHGDLLRNVIIVVAALAVAQQITMQGIAPKVMSAHVGIHPLLLFAALLVGAQEAGIWGAVFAGPVAAIIVATLDVFFIRFQQASPLYPDVSPNPENLEDYERQIEREASRGTRADARARREAEIAVTAEAEHTEHPLSPAGDPASRPSKGEAERTAASRQIHAVDAPAGEVPAGGVPAGGVRDASTANGDMTSGNMTNGDVTSDDGHPINGGPPEPKHEHLWDKLLRR